MRHVIFLFVCGRNSVEELKVLLAHEYHHICRLHQIETKETEYTLLDTMIMEGLAEQAVTERYTEKQCTVDDVSFKGRGYLLLEKYCT